MLTLVPGRARFSKVVVGVAMGLVVGASGLLVVGCGAGSDGVGVNLQRDLGPFIASGPPAPDLSQPQSQPDGATSVDLATHTSTVDLSTPGGCGTVDSNGVCDGNKLEYCNSSNSLVTKDCSSSGKVCSVSSSGYANCTST